MPIENAEENVGTIAVRRSPLTGAPVRILTLLLLFTTAAFYEAFQITAFRNGDVWWHLRTGLWILQNHAVPHHGIFSQYRDMPWIASNWGYEVLLAGLYKLIGLRAIPATLMALKVLLAIVTFLLARGWRGNFWGAVLLSAAAQYALVDLQPLPILFSILFFGVETVLLLQSRRCGDLRPLYWLPLIFLLWANLHGQFINGLLLLGVFLVATAAEHGLHNSGLSSSSPALPLGKVGAIAALSAAATLVTPFSVHLLPDALHSAYGKVLFSNFAEMSPMGFRRPQNYVLLLLVMAAFAALGRQRSRDLFKLGAMSVFVIIGFRVQRDGWCIVFPAIAVLGDFLAEQSPEISRQNRGEVWRWEKPVIASVVVVAFLSAMLHLPSSEGLMNSASRIFPTKACDFIRANQLPKPLFNAYIWGGFLIWYLPEYPVAIDGRLNLYGDEMNESFFNISAGAQRLEMHPSFTRARTVLLERRSGMAKALTSIDGLREQFRVAYQDDVAVVLVRQ